MFHGKIDTNTAKGLKELRSRIDNAKIPPSKLDETINIATWNIREFGRKPRRRESLHFIAEVLGQFDLIAIVEVRKNLSDLKTVMDILGPYWKVVYSDFVPDRGGNEERVAYLYDKRAVNFTGLAAEADPPRVKKEGSSEYLTDFNWWRSPYIASFSAGNFDFVLITAHIRWGKDENDRLIELQRLAKWVEDRRKEVYSVDKDIIVMGDFNIPDLKGELYKAITNKGKGLLLPKQLANLNIGSNLEKNKRYDQILHYPSESNVFTNKGGVLDFYLSDKDIPKLYIKNPPDKRKFTYEMSDHLPLWIQLNVDTSAEKLDQIIKAGKKN